MHKMKQRPIELLAPAKNLECGIEAINHGADAVYIGAPRFGARAAAGNSLACGSQGAVRARRRCHVRGAGGRLVEDRFRDAAEERQVSGRQRATKQKAFIVG